MDDIYTMYGMMNKSKTVPSYIREIKLDNMQDFENFEKLWYSDNATALDFLMFKISNLDQDKQWISEFLKWIVHNNGKCLSMDGFIGTLSADFFTIVNTIDVMLKNRGEKLSSYINIGEFPKEYTPVLGIFFEDVPVSRKPDKGRAISTASAKNWTNRGPPFINKNATCGGKRT